MCELGINVICSVVCMCMYVGRLLHAPSRNPSSNMYKNECPKAKTPTPTPSHQVLLILFSQSMHDKQPDHVMPRL